MTRVRAYLELARISNLPTVWSNVLVGCAIGAADSGEVAPFPWATALMLMVAMSMLYAGGMALNDVADVQIDRVERPGRPIPSGRVGRAEAGILAIGLMLLGLGILLPIAMPAFRLGLVLVALIVAYDLKHAEAAATIVLPALCRAMVYVTCAAAIAWPLDWPLLGAFAGFIFVYTLVISIVARGEAATDDPIEQARRMRRVLWLIAGISLLDAVLLAGLGRWLAAGAAGGCFVLAKMGHRRVAGT